jgi:hypothetical protein
VPSAVKPLAIDVNGFYKVGAGSVGDASNVELADKARRSVDTFRVDAGSCENHGAIDLFGRRPAHASKLRLMATVAALQKLSSDVSCVLPTSE